MSDLNGTKMPAEAAESDEECEAGFIMKHFDACPQCGARNTDECKGVKHERP